MKKWSIYFVDNEKISIVVDTRIKIISYCLTYRVCSRPVYACTAPQSRKIDRKDRGEPSALQAPSMNCMLPWFFTILCTLLPLSLLADGACPVASVGDGSRTSPKTGIRNWTGSSFRHERIDTQQNDTTFWLMTHPYFFLLTWSFPRKI